MQGRFKKYVGLAGLPSRVSPHALRHSIAVHYLVNGAPISFVQRLLGHESLATTGIYTQLADQVTKEIAINTPTALDAALLDQDRAVRERRPAYEAGLAELEALAPEYL